ncbi:V-type ATP synthase subunit A [Candidatus Kaiserbacteria bacterium]|nr:V-type ATP synthase subunit A [Candidatus Kaiserbacteria bacterium]USN91933.1 MAG: V-type ATP synthase subunit A [Candidatus Nomurabacteria bacterium]
MTNSQETTTLNNEDQATGVIERVTGPLVRANGMSSAKLYEVVKVSEEKLLGEIIELHGDIAAIQVYEETAGIGPGDVVYRTGRTMSVALAPGLLESIYDGVQRPLKKIEVASGNCYIKRGIEADAVDMSKVWKFTPTVKVGDKVESGDVLGEVQETSVIVHKVMVPPNEGGVVASIKEGEFKVTDEIVALKREDDSIASITMLQYWPIRKPRPKKNKIFPSEPLRTGGRSVDTFFPIAKGGAGCIPGPFGAGKTVTQQSIAKHCDAQIIVYIGCGERGNEMTEVLSEFPHLIDPNTGEPLMKRTILIANTSNMPVAAREASVYTGITIAEYYRDMGYNVALMADSTSRWAEAMREISGRLEEMPGEEGYPAYLSSRTAEFYERAGIVKTLGSDDRTGSLTVIGAVSPPGGDLSEPVSQATLRVTKTFWSLDADLAYKKHFPSINWLNSYSLYAQNFEEFWKKEIAIDFADVRKTAMTLLEKESKLLEIVRLVGMESLSNGDRLVLEVARMIREDFLFQNAFDKDDAYTPLERQYGILKSIVTFYDAGLDAVQLPEFNFVDFTKMPCYAEVANLKNQLKWTEEDYQTFQDRVRNEIGALAG